MTGVLPYRVSIVCFNILYHSNLKMLCNLIKTWKFLAVITVNVRSEGMKRDQDVLQLNADILLWFRKLSYWHTCQHGGGCRSSSYITQLNKLIVERSLAHKPKEKFYVNRRIFLKKQLSNFVHNYHGVEIQWLDWSNGVQLNC